MGICWNNDMMCPNCAKLAYLQTKKACVRCQGEIVVSKSVLCELCSNTDWVCSVCLKKIVNPAARPGGCGCGKK